MPQSLASQAKVDTRVLRAVDRAVAELRRGGAVVLHDGADGPSALVQAAEGATAADLAALADLTSAAPLLLLTAPRAAALGLVEDSPHLPLDRVVALDLATVRGDLVADLADPTSGRRAALGGRLDLATAPAGLDRAAVELVKLARLLPAAVLTVVTPPEGALAWAEAQDLLSASVSDVTRYSLAAAGSLCEVADAKVPLAEAEDTRIVAFRPSDGGVEHLAVIIGEPATDRPVLTRLHSECFTGDLLGSLRCDCGDQLRGAISAIAEAGAGILLYLAQEGRGIGLVNKLRAYRLQDRGADTLEANNQLGFGADERVYLPAAEMLRRLGYSRVRLLTNNPDKVSALSRCGITVDERVPHAFPSNGHNEFYLATKAKRLGHLF